MIERVNPPASRFTMSLQPIAGKTFYFPRASTLSFSYRIKPDTKPLNHQLHFQVELQFGVGNPPDFGLGAEQRDVLVLPPQIAPAEAFEQQVVAAEDDLKVAEAEVTAAEGEKKMLEVDVKGFEGEVKSAEAEVKAAEAEKAAAQTKLGVAGLGGSGLRQQLSFAAEAYAKGSTEEQLTSLGKAVSEAQSAVAEQEALIGKLTEGIAKAKEAVTRAKEVVTRGKEAVTKGEQSITRLKEINVVKAEDAITRVAREQPTGWTPLVTADYTRSIDALRYVISLGPGTTERDFFQTEFEFTIVVSRPTDIGPTYTQPFATAGGR